MAEAYPELDIFSHCKVCNAPTNRTTILKHMSFKKTLVHNVLKTCKDHNPEEYDSIKNEITELRKTKKRHYNEVNKEEIRQKQARRDQDHMEEKRRYYQDYKEEKRLSQRRYNQDHKKERTEYKRNYDQGHREENSKKEEMRRKKKQDETKADVRLINFKVDIINGPNFTCHSCNRELFRKQVELMSHEDLGELKLKESFLKEVGLKKDAEIVLCHNCLKIIRTSRIPNSNVSNGLELEEVPDVLKLNDLEQQLIARSLLFIKTVLLPKTRMKASHDNVINVPIECEDISTNILKLPRNLNDAQIIPVQLKRKVEYKTSHLEQYIRPNIVLKAVKTLKQMENKFYQDIEIHEDFMERQIKTLVIKSARDKRLEKRNALKQSKKNKEEEMEVDKDENEMEVETSKETSNSDNEDEPDVLNAVKKYQSNQSNTTFLVPNNMASMVELNNTSEVKTVKNKKGKNILQIAPGEGKITSPLMREEHFDVRAFPKHHPSGKYGLHHSTKLKLSARKYFEQRLLNKDERFSRDPCYVFTAAYFLERQSIEKQIDISGKLYCHYSQFYFSNHPLFSAGLKGTKQLKSGALKLTDMFDVFKKIKGTPKYWQAARNELIAKVKQLGPFQVFYTFSCGEMRWSEVFLSIFKRHGYDVVIPGNWSGLDSELLVEGKPLWDYINQDMSQSKHELFKKYTSLITRHFDARVKSFVNNILMGGGNGDKVPFKWYSYRVEFQARGMPHIHGVAWICPKYLENQGLTGYLCDLSENDLVTLVDKLVTCEVPNEYEESSLHNIVKEVQMHQHTQSCLKRNGICRYGFPKLPSKKTILAKPLPKEMDAEKKKKLLDLAKNTISKAKSLLEDANLNESMTLEQFVEAIDPELTVNEYMRHISITEKGTTLILKRAVNARCVNNYNKEMLTAWNANMDIQIAINPYAVISYMVNYITKTEDEVTQFMMDALKATETEEARERLKALKNAYLSHRQIGASEAVYRILPGMYLKKSNISCKFVATGFPQNRSLFYRKVSDEPDEDSHNLDRDVEEDEVEDDEVEDTVTSFKKELVSIDGRSGKYKAGITIIDRYIARPKDLERMCYAQFAISYYYQAKPPKKAVFDDGGHSEQKSEQKILNSEVFLPQNIALGKDLGYMGLRKHPAVLRIHSSNKKDGYEQYYSELQLFTHWRDEKEEFFPESEKKCLEAYEGKKKEIESNKKAIYPGEETIDILETCNLESLKPIHLGETIDGQGEQENSDDRIEGVLEDPELESLGYTGNLNLETEQNTYGSGKYKPISPPDESELKYVTRRLVPEQMNVLRQVVKSCKDVVKARKNTKVKPKPVRLIVHGGAGVGKSATINAISKVADKILRNKETGIYQPTVLLCAFTAKAARLIGGTTIHSTFGFSIGKEVSTLSDKRRAEMRHEFEHLRVIIIDEISLVSADMLYRIHMRLQEIFQTKSDIPFANINMVLVGDLLQLPPVKGALVFKTPLSLDFAANKDNLNLWESHTPMILKHNHRQGEGREWTNTLNRIREGICTEKDKQLLKSMETKDEFLVSEALHMFYRNKDVKSHNDKMLKKIDSELVVIEAVQILPRGRKSIIDKSKGTIGQTDFLEFLEV